MCGLTLSIQRYPQSQEQESLLESLCAACAVRGPDTQSTYRTVVAAADGQQVEVAICASVLGLRGEVTRQPIVGQRGVLGWNGQVFDGLPVGNGNDTALLASLLEGGVDPLDLLGKIEGPYAFVYLDLISKRVYYQLDPLSRRSLLLHVLPTPLGGTSDRQDGPSLVDSCEQAQGLLLSSVRSAEVRRRSIEMRALGGGEGGVIDLSAIRSRQGNRLDFSVAFETWTQAPRAAFTHLSPVNTATPNNGPDRPSTADVNTFIDQLTASVQRRVDNIPVFQKGAPRVAVLFSGGVDCTLLAGLLHQCLPVDEPVELINVSFAPQGSTTYQTPDRLSGIEACAELRKACPREWRFVLIDIPFEECQSHRQVVLDLMYPSSTEMDLSLAFPLYFASRGVGKLHEKGTDYQVLSKVYLSGLGADEQLGGYARHRHAFKMGSWQGLIDETQMDITRLPTRNLSRDDRIISSHARDARYPYLDLSFVAYLSALPIWIKCNPSFGEGCGDKMLLRQAAQQIGLDVTATRVKRAMQFGTRSSKMSVSKGPKAGERKVNGAG